MKLSTRCRNRPNGFTLIEILVTIIILALLVGFAIPSYRDFMDQKRLRSATEDLYNFIKTSQSRGLNLPSSYYMSFQTGTSWCYGLSDTSTCDCTSPTSCTVAGIGTRTQSSDYSGQAITVAVTGFNGSGGSPYILFEGRRGTIAATGTVTFTSALGLSTTIRANQQGLVTICSNSIKSYPSCS
jgi:prepilin-type N-terminal cleavage/methylation domain-containing protein